MNTTVRFIVSTDMIYGTYAVKGILGRARVCALNLA